MKLTIDFEKKIINVDVPVTVNELEKLIKEFGIGKDYKILFRVKAVEWDEMIEKVENYYSRKRRN
ncbi:MAG: hypothetical protein ACTSRP_28425 [Candidatus Helarchaeota archaeon]